MGVAATLPELSEWTLTELMHYGAVSQDSINAAVCTLGTLNFSLYLLNIPHRGVDFFPKSWILIAFFCRHWSEWSDKNTRLAVKTI